MPDQTSQKHEPPGDGGLRADARANRDRTLKVHGDRHQTALLLGLGAWQLLGRRRRPAGGDVAAVYSR